MTRAIKNGQWKSQAIEFMSSERHYLKSTMLMTKKVANLLRLHDCLDFLLSVSSFKPNTNPAM